MKPKMERTKESPVVYIIILETSQLLSIENHHIKLFDYVYMYNIQLLIIKCL